MRKRPSRQTSLNLDSLVDIVSNNVGILIILAVFMAIFALLQSPTPLEEEEVIPEVEKILIPWAHYSQKSSSLFLLRDNRLLHFDRYPVYDQMRNEIDQGGEPSQRFQFDDYSVNMTVFSRYVHCLDFQPKSQTGEWWHEAKTLDSLIQKLSTNEFYFFFWVDADSFELFREVRQFLWDNEFEVGWRPVAPNSPLRFCSGTSGSLSFQPQ